MKLTDQQLTVLRAAQRTNSRFRGGALVSIAQVLKAVSYPKYATKKIIVQLAEKGILALHHHDWPSSLTREERKLMVYSHKTYYLGMALHDPDRIPSNIWGSMNPGRKMAAKKSIKRKANRESIHRVVREHIRAGRNQKQIIDLMRKAGYSASYLAEARKIYTKEKQFVQRMRTGRNPSVEAAIRRAVYYLTQNRPDGERVYIAKLKDILREDGYSLAEIDTALIQMGREGKIVLMRLDDPQEIKERDRRFAVRSGGQENHIFYYQSAKNPSGKKIVSTVKKVGSKVVKVVGGAIKGGVKAAKNPRDRRKSVEEKTFTQHASLWYGQGKSTAYVVARLKRYGFSASESKRIAREARVPSRYDVAVFGKNPGYTDIVIRGTAKKTPEGWQIGKKVIPQGKGTVKVSGGYFLDRSTGMVYAKRTRNSKRNVAQGFYDSSGVFHPIRSSADYDEGRVGTVTRKKAAKKAKAKAGSSARFGATKKAKSSVKSLAARRLARTTSTGKRLKTRKRNDGAVERREQFAGKSTGHKELYFPQGTPGGLSTLGPLKLICTEAGDLQPQSNGLYLAQDGKERLYVGSTQNRAMAVPGTDYGKISRIEYQCRKPHLGEPKDVIWFHDFEAPLPRLRSDADGALHFEGGSYRIKREGIVG